jgi:hypothetical protein
MSRCSKLFGGSHIDRARAALLRATSEEFLDCEAMALAFEGDDAKVLGVDRACCNLAVAMQAEGASLAEIDALCAAYASIILERVAEIEAEVVLH